MALNWWCYFVLLLGRPLLSTIGWLFKLAHFLGSLLYVPFSMYCMICISHISSHLTHQFLAVSCLRAMRHARKRKRALVITMYLKRLKKKKKETGKSLRKQYWNCTLRSSRRSSVTNTCKLVPIIVHKGTCKVQFHRKGSVFTVLWMGADINTVEYEIFYNSPQSMPC